VIPTLYEAKTNNFSNNGLGGLPHAISCQVTEERHGQYFLEMEYPIGGLHFEDICCDRIITAPPAPGKAAQPFIIRRVSRGIDGVAKVYAPHISRLLEERISRTHQANYGSAGFSLMVNRIMNRSYPYNGGWDKFTGVSTSATGSKELNIIPPVATTMECIVGVEGSLVDLWGGEIEWDGFTIRHSERRGTDTGIKIEFGSNMLNIDAEVDMAGLVTGVVSYWQKDDVLVYCDYPKNASNASQFGTVHCIAVDVTEDMGDYYTAENPPTQEQVAKYGQYFLNDTTRNELKTSIEIGVAPGALPPFDLKPTPERNVYLCDTVEVIHSGLKLRQTSKIVKCVFNVLTEKYESITVGSIRKDISDTIASLI